MIRSSKDPKNVAAAASGGGRRALAALLSIALTLSALTSLALVQSPAAQAEVVDNGYSQTFYVNDVRDVADAAPGDGVCATRFTAGVPAVATCTLYAAIQEANARPAGESILIAPAPQIRLINGSFAASAEIDLNWNTTNNPAPQVPEMSTSMVADAGIAGVIDLDSVSRYWVKHNNVTLDFQNRLGWTLATDLGSNVLLFTGSNQTFRNFTKLTSAEAGIYVGSTAQNFSLINGAVANPATTPPLPSNYAIERGVVIVEGARNTTIQNIRFQRSYWDAVLLAPASNASLVIDGLTIDRSSWDQPVNGGTYDPAYNYFVRNYSASVSGRDILVTNNTVRAWGADGGSSDVISFLGGTWTNMMIRGNAFTATVNQAVNPIILNAIGATTTTVRDNTFTYAGPGTRGSGINYAWVRTYNTTAGVQIFNNRVVGGNNTLQLSNEALLPATTTNPTFRNTMTRVAGTVTAANENTLTTNNNIYNSSNGTIRTAFPSAAAVVATPPQTCRIDLTIAPPGTGGTAIPTQAISVDAYLGRTTATGGDNVGLEQYLGRISTTQAALPATFSLPYTGVGVGNVVRLQTTEVATGRTSQYSRTLAATGADTCAPQSWIKQGGWFSESGAISATQEDPTSFRNVSFDILTSEPLGSNGLTAADIVFSGTAPGQQVVSLTQVSDTTWTLVAKANGTGTIVPTIPAAAINDSTGNVSVGAANTTVAPLNFAGYSDSGQTTGIPGASVDHSVLYNSPLAITAPDPLNLTVAEPGSASATFRVSNLSVDGSDRVIKAPSAPVFLNQVWSGLVPDAALPTPAPPQTAAGIARVIPTHANLSTVEPTLDTIDRYVDVPVQAIDNLTVDGTRGVTLDLDVTSEDPEFDGLLLSSVSVSVTDNDRPVAASSTLAVTQDNQLADGESLNTLTATVQNAAGALVSNAPVTFDVPTGTVASGSGTVGGAGVTVTAVTDASGVATLSLTSATAGSYPVGARVNGTEEIADSPQEVTFARVLIDLASADTNYTVSSGGVVANGTAPHSITVRLIDVTGDPATGWASALSAAAAPASGVTVGTFTETATAGEYTAPVTSTTTGPKGMSVSLLDDGGVSRVISLLAGGNPNAVFVADAPVVGDGFSAITIDDSGNRLANGSAFHQVTVVLADTNHNPVTGAAARLSASVADNASGAATVTSFAETGTPGTYTALVRSAEAGAQEVTALFDGTLAVGTVTANFAAGAVDLGHPGSRVSVTTGDVPVGIGQHTVTVTLADANGNPVPGQAASLSAAPSSSLGTGTVTGFVETGTPGTYTATVTSTLAGAKAITTRLGASAVTLGGNGTATFVAGTVDLTNTASNYTVSDGDVTVLAGEHGVTVTLADEFGNPVSGRAADLEAATAGDLGSGDIGDFVETALPGTYRALVTSSVSGDKVITATLAGDDLTLDGNDTATFVAAGVDVDNIGTRYHVSVGDEVVGTGTHTITVTLSDSNGNPVSGQAEGIESTTLDPLGTGTISTFTETGVEGTYTATITSSVTGGKFVTTVFGAEDLTVLLDGNDTATFVSAPVSLSASGFEVSTGSQTAGTGSHTATIRLADALGNPVPGAAADLAATTGTPDGVSISAVTETLTPGTYSATISSTSAGAKGIAVTYVGNTVPATGNATALFVAGSVDLGNALTDYTVSGGSVSVSGGTHSITVRLADAQGNPVAARAPQLAAAAADSLGTGSIGLFVEGIPGSYTAPVTSSLAGEKAITVTYGGDPVSLEGNGIASFVSGGVAPGNVNTRYSVSGGNQPVGTGSHTVTVSLADSDGNPVSGEEAGISAESAGPLGTGSFSDFAETGTAGTYTATISSTLAGGKPVTVSFGGTPLALEGNGTATFIAGGFDLSNPASGYVVSAGSVSVSGGSHSVTVTLGDQFGNPVSGQAFQMVATTAAALGTGTVSGFSETGTAGTYTATITSSNAGAKPITATLGGDDLALLGNGTATFIAGGVSTANAGTRFSVSGGFVPAGTGSHTITVTLADALGNPVSDQAVGINASTTGDLGTGTVTPFAETGTAGTYLATITSTSSGGKTIAVSFGGSGVTTVSNNVANFSAGEVDPASPFTGYAVSTGEASVSGGSHTVTVTLADALGNPVTGQAAALAADTADPLGTGILTGFTETSTEGTYTATITSSVSGGKTVTATFQSGALTLLGNSTATFVAGSIDTGNAGTHYSVSTGDQPVGTGSHTITVLLADALGNPVSGQAAVLTAQSANSLGDGSFSVFTETGTAGTYEATVTATLVGDKVLTAQVNGDPISLTGNDTATFVAGSVDLASAGTAYSVSTGDETVVTGEHTVTVTLEDSLGNPVSGREADLAANTADPLGTGSFGDFTETATAGTYEATITSSLAGAKAITVTLSSEALTAAGNSIATFVAGAVDPGNAGTSFTVSGGNQPVSTGTHTVTVRLADAGGNPISGQAAALLATTTDPLGTGSVLGFTETLTPGTYEASLSSTVSGGKVITVTVAGEDITLSGNGTATFIAGAVDLSNSGSVYAVSGGSQTVGSGGHTVTVTLADEFGNPVPGQAAELGAATTDPLGTGTVSPFTESGTAGSYTATVTSTVSGSKTITATLSSTDITLGGNGIALFAAGVVDLGNSGSSFAVSTGNASIAGGSHLITVTLADALGNPVPGQASGLDADTLDPLGSGTVSPFTESVTTPGTYTATITSSVSGGKNVTVLLGTDPVFLVGNNVATFIAGGVDLTSPDTRYTVSTGNETVGTGTHTVTVTLVDAAGNPVPGQAATLTTDTTGSLGTGTVSPFTETDTDGTYTATITSTVSGDKVLTVLLGGSPITVGDNDTAVFVAGAVDLGNPATRYFVSEGEQTVGSGSHTITVQLVDSLDNPVTGQAATLTPATTGDLGTGTLTGFVETATAGTYTATVIATVPGPKPVTVTAGGPFVTLDGNGTALFVPGGVDLGDAGSGFVVSEGEVSIEAGEHSVTVTLADALGNPVSGRASDLLATTPGDLGVGGGITVFTETATGGTYTAIITSTVSGDKTVAVTLAGDSVTASGNAVAAFIAGGVDPDNAGTGFSVSTGEQVVGAGSHTVTVTLADVAGNPVTGSAAGLLAVATGLGTGDITDFTETGTLGTYTASVTATLAGSKVVSVTYGGSDLTADGNDTAVFVASGISLANSSSVYSVSAGDVSVDGGAHAVTVTLADEFGNPVSGEAANLVATTTDPLGSGTVSPFSETAPVGTYRATITSSVAGLKVVTATLSGDPITLDGNDTARFIAGGVDPDNGGTTYSVSTGPETVSVGSHTVTVTLADADGNPVSGQASGIDADTRDDLGLGTITGFIETDTDGTYTATITSTVSGEKTVTVVYGADPVTLVGNGVASFVAGAIDFDNAGTAFTVSSGDESVSTGEHTVTVTLSDDLGNPVPGQAAGLDADTADSLGTGSFSAFTESAGAPGTYTATVTSTLAGDKDITVTLGVNSVQASGNSVASFIAGGVDLANSGSGYSVSTGDASVDGGSHTVTVTLADEFGNPVSDAAGTLLADATGDLGSGTISVFTELGGTPGTYTASVTSSLAGDKTITVTLSGDDVTASGNTVATFIAGGVDTGNPGTRFSVSGGTEVVGLGAHTVTVTLADADGNPVSGAAAGLTLDTASAIGTGSLGTFTETATDGTYTATVTSSVAGDKTMTVDYAGDAVSASGNAIASFIAGDVDLAAVGSGYSVSTGDETVGTGSHTVTVTLVDALDNPVSGRAADLVADTVSDLGTGTFSAFTEVAGTPGSYTATVTATVAGVKAITVTLSGDDMTLGGNGNATFIAGVVNLATSGTEYTVSTGDETVGTGSHTVTVTLLDSLGNGVPGQAALLVGAAADLGTGGVSSFTPTADAGVYEATITSSVAGDKAVTVAFDGDAVAASGNTTAAFVAGGVDLGNAGTAYSVSGGDEIVGTGSHTVTVTLADDLGNPVSGQAAQLLGAATGLGTGTVTGFVETATLGTYTATITSSVSGSKAVTVTLGGDPVPLSGNGSAAFIAGAVDLGNAGSSYSVSGGSVSVAGGSHLVTILLADDLGNPVPGQAATLLAAAANLGTGSVSAVTESATVPGSYEATVTSSVSGDKAVTVTLGGDAVTLSGNGTATFAAGGVDPGNANTTFDVSTGDQPVGTGSHTITVRLADAAGNPVPEEAAALSADTVSPLGSGSFSGFTESATVPGTYTATVTSSVSGGKVITVLFGADPVAALGNATAAFVAGGVDLTNPGTSYSVSTGSQPVGSGEHTVTILLADDLGNPVPGQAAGLVAGSSGLGTGTVGAVTESGTAGTYTATITSTVSGLKPVTVTLGGEAVAASGNTDAAFIAGAVDPGNPGTSYSVSGGQVSVSGGSHLVTILLVDALGNPAPGHAAESVATTAANLGTGSVSAVTETGTPGTYTATVTSSVAGDKAITATVGAVPITLLGNGTAVFIAGGVDPGNSGTSFSVSGGDETVGAGSHTLTVLLADAEGNPVPDQAGCLAAGTTDGLGTGTIGVFTETATAGTYEASITSTSAGNKTMTVTCGASDLSAVGNDVASFVAATVDPSGLGTSFEVSTGEETVGTGSHSVTVTLADAFGNPVSGQAALIVPSTADPLGTGTVTGVVESGTAGVYTATITSTVAGDKTIGVTFDGTAVTAGSNAVATFVAGGVDLGSPDSSYSVSGGGVSVSGGSHLVTILLADALGNPVPGQAALLLASTTDGLGSGTVSTVIETGTPGTYTATVTSSLAGDKVIAVTLDGDAVTLSGNDTATFVPGGVDLSNSGTRFQLSGGSQTVGTGSHTVTVTLVDAGGNPVSGQAAGLSADSSPGLGQGGISGFTETGTPGTYTATITSTTAGQKTVTVFFGGSPITVAGSGVIEFVAGATDLGSPSSHYSVSVGSVPVGSATHTITVALTDEFGNPVSGETGLAAGTTGTLGTGTLSPFAETLTPGTYAATVTSTIAGTKPVTVTLDGDPVTLSGNGGALFVSAAADPAQTVIEATSPVSANGSDYSTVTVSLFDQFGNPVTQQVPVTVTSTLGTAGATAYQGGGVYTAQLRSTTGGTATVSATVNGTPVTASAEVVFVDGTPPAPPALDPTDGSTVTGCAEPGSTVTVYDANGTVIGTAVAGDDCRFVVTLSPPQQPGSEITVTVTDLNGNVSDSVTIRVGLLWMELEGDPITVGGIQRAYGHNFQPGEVVSGLIQSDPISLGTQVADESGDVAFEIRIPDSFELGVHTITLSGGFSGSVDESFTVIAKKPGLSITGAGDGLPLALGGLGLLVGGLVLVLVRRRRERADAC
ncbi:hypothetical protein GCM10022198_11360 [Klugiella xanthotipulae]|uniref:Adhesin/invasin n=1 Tax=Klugiella xanthotipulae TaxID=244735 RepID=A0A543HZ32_9MICO|nr:invasin domain 3-containing protein [Klugiella xanthotipulae]TQM63530.1 adhesin/invasin [Klugiella xanthotipulae]